MKIYLKALILFSTLCSFPVFADHNVESYVAKKNGVELTIIGITHGGRKEIWPPSDPMLSAFEKADVVFTEIDITNAAQMKKSRERFQNASAMAIKEFLNESELEDVRRAILKNSPTFRLSTQTLKTFHACAVGLLAMPIDRVSKVSTVEEQREQVPAQSYEKYFLGSAQRQGKKIVALEPNGAMAICELLEFDEIRQLAIAALELQQDKEALNTYFESRKNSFIQFQLGEGEKHYSTTIDGLKFNESYVKSFLHWIAVRNHKMVEVLNGEMQQLQVGQSGLVLVGSLHLYGEDGVLTLLKRSDFTVIKNL